MGAGVHLPGKCRNAEWVWVYKKIRRVVNPADGAYHLDLSETSSNRGDYRNRCIT